MKVYIAVDKKNGLVFNNRRHSHDRIMRENMLKDCGDAKLWIAEYSRRIFTPTDGSAMPDNIIIDNDCLDKAGPDDCCFVENISPVRWYEKINTFVIYHWNTTYPADVYFDLSLENLGWKRFSSNDFKGSSHDKITKEVWKRE